MVCMKIWELCRGHKKILRTCLSRIMSNLPLHLSLGLPCSLSCCLHSPGIRPGHQRCRWHWCFPSCWSTAGTRSSRYTRELWGLRSPLWWTFRRSTETEQFLIIWHLILLRGFTHHFRIIVRFHSSLCHRWLIDTSLVLRSNFRLLHPELDRNPMKTCYITFIADLSGIGYPT